MPPPGDSKPISRTYLRTTTNPSTSDIDTFLNLLSTSYLAHPLTTAFITESDSTSPELTPDRLKAYFRPGLNDIAKSNVLLTFAYPSSSTNPDPTKSNTSPPLAAALFEPPLYTPPQIPNPSTTKDHPAPGPVLTSYRTLSAQLKSRHLSIPSHGAGSYSTPAAPSQSAAAPTEDPYPAVFNKEVGGGEGRRVYDLAFLARENYPGKGDGEAVAELIAEYQGRAGAEGVPIWCVVGTEEEKLEFEGLGFRAVESQVVGEGVVGEEGRPEEGGRGVRVWAMLWEAAEEAV